MDTAKLINILIPIGFLAVFYFLLVKPQQKREKAVKEMRDSLAVGDEVVTIGGIIGKVVKISDSYVTIEAGADKLKFNVEKWGIGKKLSQE